MPSAAFIEPASSPLKMKRPVSQEWLNAELRSEDGGTNRILILDCRLQSDYVDGHVRGAINVTLPTLLLRRLANGKIAISSLIKCVDSREIFARHWKSHTIVLYGESDDENLRVERENNSTSADVVLTLYRRLEQDGCHVVYLQGGFSEFQEKFPEWCSSSLERSECEAPLIGLQNLRISPSGGGGPQRRGAGGCGSDTDSSSCSEDLCDSCLDLSGEPFEEPGPFPVEILPNLFLGNARNSADMEALDRHKIRYILNVTSDLPNIFKHNPHIRYLQIPISDHWSQNLASFFPEAIAFIDEARGQQVGVLVHCLAGISRSVTVTVAYLMHKFSMPLNDAYELVKKRKANISPNFSFMGQLLDYEKELNLSPASCLPICHLPTTTGGPTAPAAPPSSCPCPPHAPCLCLQGTTPDSGIDIGNWV